MPHGGSRPGGGTRPGQARPSAGRQKPGGSTRQQGERQCLSGSAAAVWSTLAAPVGSQAAEVPRQCGLCRVHWHWQPRLRYSAPRCTPQCGAQRRGAERERGSLTRRAEPGLRGGPAVRLAPGRSGHEKPIASCQSGLKGGRRLGKGFTATRTSCFWPGSRAAAGQPRQPIWQAGHRSPWTPCGTSGNHRRRRHRSMLGGNRDPCRSSDVARDGAAACLDSRASTELCSARPGRSLRVRLAACPARQWQCGGRDQ